jgi:hypothetical protein
MRKTVLTILGTLLIAGSTVEMAAASKYHVRTGPSYDQSDFRRAYNQSNEPLYESPQTGARQNIEDLGSSGRDRTWCSWADCTPPWEHSAHGG